MKLQSRKYAGFLKRIESFRGLLLFGEDAGLVREQGQAALKHVIGGSDDPFRLSCLQSGDSGALVGEFQAASMTGGRRVVHVGGANDGWAAPVKAALATRSDSLLILEAGDLNSRSKLRILFEGTDDLAACACYSEAGPDLERTIDETLRSLGHEPTREAMAFLSAHLGNDRGITRQELEKLSLSIGDERLVSFEAASAICGDMNSVDVDDAIFCALSGDRSLADHKLERALADGATAVGMLRRMLSHTQRLMQLRSTMMRDESDAASVVRNARPPVFFRLQPIFTKILSSWSIEDLFVLARNITEAELRCKQSGMPDQWICRNLFVAVADCAASPSV